jgi:hypothetical protein
LYIESPASILTPKVESSDSGLDEEVVGCRAFKSSYSAALPRRRASHVLARTAPRSWGDLVYAAEAERPANDTPADTSKRVRSWDGWIVPIRAGGIERLRVSAGRNPGESLGVGPSGIKTEPRPGSINDSEAIDLIFFRLAENSEKGRRWSYRKDCQVRRNGTTMLIVWRKG